MPWQKTIIRWLQCSRHPGRNLKFQTGIQATLQICMGSSRTHGSGKTPTYPDGTCLGSSPTTLLGPTGPGSVDISGNNINPLPKGGILLKEEYMLAFILREIALAQASSDAGKGISAKSFNRIGGRNTARKGYADKVTHQVRAITAISKTPRCGINYYVIREGDQNGFPSVLVYFEIKRGVVGNNEPLQLSFHNPQWCSSPLVRFVGKGRPTRWDHQLGGSRKAASLIADYLSKEGAF